MNNFQRLFAFSRSYSLEGKLKNYLRVVLVWCPIVSVMFMFGFGGLDNFPLRFAISMIIAITVSTSCILGSWTIDYLFSFYRFRRGWEVRKNGVFWGVLTSFPFLVPGLYLGFLFAAQFSSAIGHAYSPPRFKDYSSGVIFGIMVSGLFTLFEFMRESKEAKQTAELKFRNLENENLKAQISALTAQMNPHLLFNSLNTIASTISTDPISAEDMVVRLSELYRGILKSAKGDMHSLENELLLCKSYLEIEKKRFGDRIDYIIHVEDSVDIRTVKIPVLLLQPLVENAVKHGISPKRDGGQVSIEVKRVGEYLIINVIDNGVGIDFKKPSIGTGTALANCESRIKLKYGGASRFSFARNEKNETMASIQIPIMAAFGD